MRTRFDAQLLEVRDEIVRMGSLVSHELAMALKALAAIDVDLAQQVILLDEQVNAQRNMIEERCITLIATQQPAASDLRGIITAMSLIVDLERMGDQAKGIARLIPDLEEHPRWVKIEDLMLMGELVGRMHDQAMEAYVTRNAELAQSIPMQDDAVDEVYGRIFAKVIEVMANTKKQEKVEIKYDLLRAAQELERFGDLASNVARRVAYMVTG